MTCIRQLDCSDNCSIMVSRRELYQNSRGVEIIVVVIGQQIDALFWTDAPASFADQLNRQP